jgi:hypothetical protein
VSDAASDTWVVPSGLAVRLGVRVGVLALLLFGRDEVDDEDHLAPDDLGDGSLGAQDPRLVAAKPALEEVDVPVGGERVQLVVPVSAEEAVGASAAVERVVALAARDVVRPLVPGRAIVPVAAVHLIAVRSAVQTIWAVATCDEVVAAPAVDEVGTKRPFARTLLTFAHDGERVLAGADASRRGGFP